MPRAFQCAHARLQMDELYVDMRQFCMSYSNVKEAAALYQTVTLMHMQNSQST